ncbi:hypothetical protein EB57_01765 [Enterococcus faecalis]|jgi:hypothetical protein|nr:hypothetical protein EB57_01765 [Enterococcus faecalis]
MLTTIYSVGLLLLGALLSIVLVETVKKQNN